MESRILFCANDDLTARIERNKKTIFFTTAKVRFSLLAKYLRLNTLYFASMSQASSPIAIFDSGIGGLNVLYEAVKKIGGDFIYYADTIHVPYGEKTKEEVHKYISEAVAFLAKKNIKA